MAICSPALAQYAAPEEEEASREVSFERDQQAAYQLSDLDGIMNESIRNFRVPGAALAVATNGHLIYARGFGSANLRTGEQATERTLFNLASCTKAISMLGVLSLVQAGRLQLDEPIYDAIGRPPLPPGRRADPLMYQATIRQLLHHSAGWNDDSGFQKATKAIMRAAPNGMPYPRAVTYLLTTPLDYPPGTQAKYANGQWNLVKYVIECASGQPYGQYMRSVLASIGIHDMINEHRGYRPGEAVRYEGYPPRQIPGGQSDVALMPSFGNWLASAVDMVRFMTALDGSRIRFLSPELYNQVLAELPPPMVNRPNGTHFGLGLDVVRVGPRGVFYSKNGGKAGVHAQIEHLPNGVDFALFMNGGVAPDGGKTNPLGPTLKRLESLLSNLESFPSVDQFQNCQ